MAFSLFTHSTALQWSLQCRDSNPGQLGEMCEHFLCATPPPNKLKSLISELESRWEKFLAEKEVNVPCFAFLRLITIIIIGLSCRKDISNTKIFCTKKLLMSFIKKAYLGKWDTFTRIWTLVDEWHDLYIVNISSFLSLLKGTAADFGNLDMRKQFVLTSEAGWWRLGSQDNSSKFQLIEKNHVLDLIGSAAHWNQIRGG